MDTHVFARQEWLAHDVARQIESRNMRCIYAPHPQAARDAVLKLIEPGDVVTWGGSTTLQQLGIKEALLQDNRWTVLNRDGAATPEERVQIDRQAFTADTYLCSANAIAATGELVNIDGNANRVAALAFGPKRVIVVASINKIAPTLDAALERARNVAAPANALRFDCGTPCTVKGRCFDCKADKTVCAQILITRFSAEKHRITVVLVNGEDAGF